MSNEVSSDGIGKKVEDALRNLCIEIKKRYEIKFLEIGADEDHVHFLVQSVSDQVDVRSDQSN